MRVRCYSTGRVRLKRSARGPRRYFPGGWSDSTLPVNAFAVEHPDGVCVFDTGQTVASAPPGLHPFSRLARFELGRDDELAAQLRRDGLAPEDVRWVVLSHLHVDHVGGVAAFPTARVLVPRLEWERAQGLAGRLRGYRPGRWPSSLQPELVDFAGPPAGPFPASHDVAGDRRLLLVPLPGHTPGHAGLLVDRRLLLAGDAPHTPEGLPAAGAHDTRAATLAGEALR